MYIIPPRHRPSDKAATLDGVKTSVTVPPIALKRPIGAEGLEGKIKQKWKIKRALTKQCDSSKDSVGNDQINIQSVEEIFEFVTSISIVLVVKCPVGCTIY